jgi:Spy/CpxP family protein refolding chaperone
MRLLEIQSALNLDEATTLKLSAIFKRHDAARDKMFEEVRKEMQALRALAREPKPDDTKLSAAVDKLVALRQKMPEIQMAQIAEARKVLTPLQQAKLVLHMAKFKKNFRNMMHKSFMRRGGHGGPGGGGMGPGRGRGPRPGGPGGGPGGDPEMGPPPRGPAGGNPAGGNPGAPPPDEDF